MSVVTRKSLLAAAVATGVAATGVAYFSEAVAPAAQSTSVAPVVAAIPAPAAFATPNPLLEAATGGTVSSADVAPQAVTVTAVRVAGGPRHAAPVQARENVTPTTRFIHPTAAVVGDSAAPLVTAAGPAANPAGILGAFVAVFISNGDQPGENGGLLIGNGGNGGDGGNGGTGGVFGGNGGTGGAGIGTTASSHGGTGKLGRHG